jgi:rubredoxin
MVVAPRLCRHYPPGGPIPQSEEELVSPAQRRYRCPVCSHVYDPAEGDPPANVSAGTGFASMPEEWSCPDCGGQKADFEEME